MGSVSSEKHFPPPPGTFTLQPGYELNQMRAISESYLLPATITSQPIVQLGQATIWMPLLPAMEGIPEGLGYLMTVNKVIIQQVYEVLELVNGFQTRNKYLLKNDNGEQMYYVFEESGCCQRQCCGSGRGFTIHVVGNYKREVMCIKRPFMCCAGACNGIFADVSCCSSSCTIEAPPGNLIGTVQQRSAFCVDAMKVEDATGVDILDIVGPCCCFLYGCQDKKFLINTEGETIGSITKKWDGCIFEMFTDEDVFSVTFPIDLNVNAKAIILGAAFLIDCMEFEDSNKKTH